MHVHDIILRKKDYHIFISGRLPATFFLRTAALVTAIAASLNVIGRLDVIVKQNESGS
jgi:hypothetical protein